MSLPSGLHSSQDASDVCRCGQVNEEHGGRTKRDLFVEALQETTGLAVPELEARLDTECCYMFEVLHPAAVVIIRPEAPRLAHIGTRDMTSLKEVDADIGVPGPQRHTGLSDLGAVCTLADSIHSLKAEGFVVTDTRGGSAVHSRRRLKVKSLGYMRAHAALPQSLNASFCVVGFCASTWLSGEISEYCV